MTLIWPYNSQNAFKWLKSAPNGAFGAGRRFRGVLAVKWVVKEGYKGQLKGNVVKLKGNGVV